SSLPPLLRDPSSPFFFLLLLPRPPRSTLFPYTTLFRSHWADAPGHKLFMPQPFAAGLFARCHAQHEIKNLVAHGLDALLTVRDGDRKSTRLNSSHVAISYAVFCLKKKKSRRHSASGNNT